MKYVKLMLFVEFLKFTFEKCNFFVGMKIITTKHVTTIKSVFAIVIRMILLIFKFDHFAILIFHRMLEVTNIKIVVIGMIAVRIFKLLFFEKIDIAILFRTFEMLVCQVDQVSFQIAF